MSGQRDRKVIVARVSSNISPKTWAHGRGIISEYGLHLVYCLVIISTMDHLALRQNLSKFHASTKSHNATDTPHRRRIPRLTFPSSFASISIFAITRKFAHSSPHQPQQSRHHPHGTLSKRTRSLRILLTDTHAEHFSDRPLPTTTIHCIIVVPHRALLVRRLL